MSVTATKITSDITTASLRVYIALSSTVKPISAFGSPGCWAVRLVCPGPSWGWAHDLPASPGPLGGRTRPGLSALSAAG